jgi:hypothetical protein
MDFCKGREFAQTGAVSTLAACRFNHPVNQQLDHFHEFDQ